MEFFFREYVTEKAYHLFGRSTLGWTSATTHTHSNTISSDTPMLAWLIIQPATGYKRVPCYQEVALKITHIIVLAISWLLGWHFSSLSPYISLHIYCICLGARVEAGSCMRAHSLHFCMSLSPPHRIKCHVGGLLASYYTCS